MWYPPEKAKWKVARDMRLYIVGLAHLKWALCFMHKFVVMDYKDGKWRAGRNPVHKCYRGWCHTWKWTCRSQRNKGAIPVQECRKWRSGCDGPHTQEWFVCDPCQNVYRMAQSLNLKQELMNDRDLVEYQDRIRRALVTKYWIKVDNGNNQIEEYYQLMHSRGLTEAETAIVWREHYPYRAGPNDWWGPDTEDEDDSDSLIVD